MTTATPICSAARTMRPPIHLPETIPARDMGAEASRRSKPCLRSIAQHRCTAGQQHEQGKHHEYARDRLIEAGGYFLPLTSRPCL